MASDHLLSERLRSLAKSLSGRSRHHATKVRLRVNVNMEKISAQFLDFPWKVVMVDAQYMPPWVPHGRDYFIVKNRLFFAGYLVFVVLAGGRKLKISQAGLQKLIEIGKVSA